MGALGWRRMVWRGSLLAVALVLGWFLLAFAQVHLAASGAQSVDANAGAVVVLGAAQYNGEPSPVFRRRLETAYSLWEEGSVSQVITTGSNQPGDAFTEGFAGYQYLRRVGIPEEQIVVIVDGGDTFESLLAVANQLDDDQRSVLLVTDAYHALRSREIAIEVGLDPIVVAAGDDAGVDRTVREAIAVGLGRVVSYRRLSAWR